MNAMRDDGIGNLVQGALEKAVGGAAAPRATGAAAEVLRSKSARVRGERQQRIWRELCIVEAHATAHNARAERDRESAEAFRLVGELARLVRAVLED